MERFYKRPALLIIGVVLLLTVGCVSRMPVNPDRAQLAAETAAKLLFTGDYETIAASALPDSGITVEALEEVAALKLVEKGKIQSFRDVYCEACDEHDVPCTRVTLVVKCESGQLILRMDFTESLELASFQME